MPVESAADLAVFFNADEFAATAVYVPPGGGAGVPCSILIDLREEGAAHGQGEPLAGQGTVEVQKVEIAAPAQGGVFTVTAPPVLFGAYTIMDRPIAADDTGTVWSMWAIKSSPL
jgi:hypothetical protein